MRYGERLKDIVEAAVARGDAPGVVAAVARGDDIYVTAAGVQTVGGPPMRPDTLFRISSVPQPIPAAALLARVRARLPRLTAPPLHLLPAHTARPPLPHPPAPP